ncbi:Flp pilus assembly protein CpaB [Cellulomonas humilata]|uniref:Flp pilus assembly protein CpaB n=1 Tax=Cellulomonas humilata TaxID=144055 RepID=A0A7Y5ZZE5_9CELL|nr:Flp pilus assembly protein CpaB [Cellulomonas humilata]NUU16906.1 Flp pilus assembly protein CpaB [Cellulomonas humilata]
MHPQQLAGRPAPLPHRRRPFAVALRSALWRWRFAVAAVLVGTAAACTVQSLRPADPPTSAVVVASREIPAGTTLTSADVRVARFPRSVAPAGAVADPAEVIGGSAAVPLGVGVPVLSGLLADDEVRGPPGTVVATVRFADPAVAGLLSPGVRVDVLAATPEGGPGGVVATRALVLPVARQDSPGGALGLSGSGDASVPVLLAVSPTEAPALAGAAASALLSAVVVP